LGTAFATAFVERDRKVFGLFGHLDDDTVAFVDVDRMVDDGFGVLADSWVHTGSRVSTAKTSPSAAI